MNATPATRCTGRVYPDGYGPSARKRTAWRPCARTTTDPSGRCPSHRKASQQ